jgi:hypothetical protein
MRVTYSVIVGLAMCSGLVWAQTNACDLVSPSGAVDAADVQAAVEMSLGVRACPGTLNIAGLGVCNAVMVQRVINASLGRPCATPTGHGASISWAASASPATVGYNVYRATTSAGPYTKLNSALVTSRSFEDTSVQAGTTYYYAVTAVDANNRESTQSTAVPGKIPTP